MGNKFNNKNKVVLGGTSNLFSSANNANSANSANSTNPVNKFSSSDNTVVKDKPSENEVIEIELQKLYAFPEHPFKVVDDDAMENLRISIKNQGVLEPIIVRKRPDGGYWVLSGHRRCFACRSLGLTTIPAVLKECDETDAVNIMVDSNILRPEILPSEKAFAYKLKKEANDRKGARTDLTGEVVDTAKEIGALTGDSRNTVFRYIRLTQLNSGLLELVDNRKINVTVASEFYAKFSQSTQTWILEYYDEHKTLPNKLQLSEILKRDSSLDTSSWTKEAFLELMERAAIKRRKITLDTTLIDSYFPTSFTEEQIMQELLTFLKNWKTEHGESEAKQETEQEAEQETNQEG